MENVALEVVETLGVFVVPTRPVGLITEAFITVTVRGDPIAATPVSVSSKSVEAITVPRPLTITFGDVITGVPPASTATPLITAEPCTEPRVSPL
jgi:hypothetical protein